MYKLRPYQRAAVDAAKDCYRRKKNGVMVLPTGSGKSLIVASLTEELDCKTLVLQPTKEILEQNLSKILAVGCKHVGVYSASMGKKNVNHITLATIGSVVKKGFLFSDFDLIIIDECHKVNSKEGMYSKLIDQLDLPCIGLTATPYRMLCYRHFSKNFTIAESRIITRTRPRIFSEFAHITQIQELFDAQFLCPLDYSVNEDYDSGKIKTTSTGRGFDDKSLEKYNDERGIVEQIVSLVSNTDRKHCLAFTQLTSESIAAVEELNGLGIKAATVNAKTKKADREDILHLFKQGHIKCVVNVGVLTTGFDFPELDCLILGRPTRSVALYYQMVGRGIRIAENKPCCELHDLCDNVERFGKIETFKLIDQNGKGMWRLRSSAGNLTGVNVITGKNLEKVAGGPSEDGDGNPMITFGKHAGELMCDVPREYLDWCSENLKPGDSLIAVRQELDLRNNLTALTS